MSNGVEIAKNELAMKEAFLSQSKTVLTNEARFMKPPCLRVGLEMEAALVGGNGEQVSEQVRDAIVFHHPFSAQELGASQIEWRTEPIRIDEKGGLNMLVQQAEDRNRFIVKSANQLEVNVLRSGTNPFISIPEIKRTNKKKYELVPDHHNQHRVRKDTLIGHEEKVDVGDAAVVSLLSSLQCNIQAKNFIDAIDLTNRSMMIGPLIVALSGNARFLDGTDTGMADVRMTAWETSHDVRDDDQRKAGKALRVGLPDRYFKDMADYFDRISQHPFILNDPDHALPIGIGLFWQDTRIKVIGDDTLVVEFRPVSIQPSVEEDLAVMLFYLGRLEWSKIHNEELLPIDQVRENRALAMTHGIKPFQELLGIEIDRAEEALLSEGVDDSIHGFMDILRDRVKTGLTPSDKVAKQVKLVEGIGFSRQNALLCVFGLKSFAMSY